MSRPIRTRRWARDGSNDCRDAGVRRGAGASVRVGSEAEPRFAEYDPVPVARGHALQFGVRLQRTTTDARDQSNFGGTFEFGSLAQLAAGFAAVSHQPGHARGGIHGAKAHGFLQDEIAITRDLTVTVGLRHDWQSSVSDRNNVAPRVGFAWVPPASRKKTVVRGGGGVFYDDLPGRPPSARCCSTVCDFATVIADPSYPDPFGSGLIVTPPPSTVRIAPICGRRLWRKRAWASSRSWGRTG